MLNISTGASQKVMIGVGLYSAGKLAMERWAEYLDFELQLRDEQRVAVNTLRVDRVVATEGWRYIAATRGVEMATAGSPEAVPVTTESVASVAAWMLEQPVTFRGNTLDFAAAEALGAPRVVDLDGTALHFAGPTGAVADPVDA